MILRSLLLIAELFFPCGLPIEVLNRIGLVCICLTSSLPKEALCSSSETAGTQPKASFITCSTASQACLTHHRHKTENTAADWDCQFETESEK